MSVEFESQHFTEFPEPRKRGSLLMRMAFKLGATSEKQAFVVLGALSLVCVILSIIVLRIGLTPNGTGPLPRAEVEKILEKTAHPPLEN